MICRDPPATPPPQQPTPFPLPRLLPKLTSGHVLGALDTGLHTALLQPAPFLSATPLRDYSDREGAFVFFSFTHLNPLCLLTINRIDLSIYIPLFIYLYLCQMYRRRCPYLAAHANGILYWPSLWHACLAFFSTFWATLKTSESSHETLHPTARTVV